MNAFIEQLSFKKSTGEPMEFFRFREKEINSSFNIDHKNTELQKYIYTHEILLILKYAGGF